ncbi:hypothetical protein TY91_07325 [Secundilactobacillus collinoides]|uniref:Uncharacterized protein n=1 Tax=Secundilactobacillus collinoides TaxID=33960 RepID=A0A161VID0_SECCO|nr:hypothetical protein TY91_07325 [Secundilactobacillus collinoides]
MKAGIETWFESCTAIDPWMIIRFDDRNEEETKKETLAEFGFCRVSFFSFLLGTLGSVLFRSFAFADRATLLTVFAVKDLT